MDSRPTLNLPAHQTQAFRIKGCDPFGLVGRGRQPLAKAMGSHPAAAESLRLLLAKDWIAMGEQLSKAPGGSVLLVDPQSPAALLTALKGLQGQKD